MYYTGHRVKKYRSSNIRLPYMIVLNMGNRNDLVLAEILMSLSRLNILVGIIASIVRRYYLFFRVILCILR